MSSPQGRLFRLPELLYQILLHLSKGNISSLMLTSRITYTQCAPFLYNTLSFEYSSHKFNILESTLAKEAVSRNAHHVQKLTVSQVDLSFLFNCLLAHEYLQTRQYSSSSTSTKGMSGSFPPIYLPPPDICPIDVVPMCPMVNLTDLTLSLGHKCIHRHSSYRVPSFDNSIMAVAQACWIISLSPHLLHLKIHDLVIKKHREIRLLGETIYGRSRLRSLDLKLLVRGVWHREGWYKAGSTVVFNCPKSIQKLWMELEYIGLTETPTDSNEGEYEMHQYHHHYQPHFHDLSFDFGDEDMDVSEDEEVDSDEDMEVVYDGDNEENEDADDEDSQGMDYEKEEEEEAPKEDKEPPMAPWSLRTWESQQCDEDELMSRPERCEPLMELVDVKLWNFHNGITEDQLVWLYEHCCMVEKLGISLFESEIDPQVVANIIKTFCTRIKKLTFSEADYGGWSGTLPYEILSAMPDQQLIEIDFQGAKFKLTKEMAQSSILRHSTTLTTVVFQECQHMSSDAIRAVLSECVSLVDFQVNWDEDEVVSFIHLADAVAIPWASNKFTRLHLTIGLPRVKREIRQGPYYLRSPRCILSLQEKGYFAQLGTLYHQLASLQDLEHLDLRALQTRPKKMTIQDPFYFDNTFSAMLSLGDPRIGRPGFLELFGRWTKLKVLKGSFSVSTDETRETMGCLEATWMASHWPLLEEAEFFQGVDHREAFEWLEKYRQHDDPEFSLGL
ncbi:MAG: hypothetical protein J3R72DRAFT_486714 [Linnemannia gamsii]|nr:MAG: hypothetical protein J3R72DRAFT_486714 [Linnemannia gamsii]